MPIPCPCKWQQDLLHDGWRVTWESVNFMRASTMSASHRNQCEGTTQSLQSPDRPRSKRILSLESSNKSPSVHGSKRGWSHEQGQVNLRLRRPQPYLQFWSQNWHRFFPPQSFSPVFMCFALIISRFKLWNVQQVASLRASESNSGHQIFMKS